MNERTTEVLEQYELEVQSKRRGRGAWICETSQGLKLLREYKGTVKRLEFEEQIMNVLQNQKTCRTDQYMRNREGELLSVAEDGTRCVVKEWFSGRECSVQSEAEVVRAVGQIAKLHRTLRGIAIDESWNLGSILTRPAVAEMERRYHLFAENNVRDIKSFNKLAAERPDLEKMPYIAIIIDELADLMMVVGKDVEDSICRIAQKARAAGMHLIVATQRPSVDVITGLIKANIPSRIAFAVSSQVDSRTILDGSGAEKLLGMGDMLFMPVGAPKPTRIQGTFVRDEEISRVLDFIKQSGTVQYDEAMIEAMEKHAIQDGKKGSGGADSDEDPDTDPMFKQAVEVVIDAGQASTSLLQRRCKLGYARAARIMDEMEQKGIIGPYEGAKPRAVLISRQQWIEQQMNQPEE